jgi:hypothetical protein
LGLVARIVTLIAGLAFLVIAIGILLIVLDANPDNAVVEAMTDAARFLVGPFDGLFSFSDSQLETAVNWGIAAFVWLIVGALIARLLTAVAPRGRRRKT